MPEPRRGAHSTMDIIERYDIYRPLTMSRAPLSHMQYVAAAPISLLRLDSTKCDDLLRRRDEARHRKMMRLYFIYIRARRKHFRNCGVYYHTAGLLR